eukprot:jgi/Botrbrau1/614/Bobra.0161s0010.1
MDVARICSGSFCSTTCLRTPFVPRCRPVLTRCRAVCRSDTGFRKVDRRNCEKTEILVKPVVCHEDVRNIALPSVYSLPGGLHTSAALKGLAALVTVIALHAGTALPGSAAETLPADILRSWLSLIEDSPVGPLVFYLTVAGTELIPLFPTQPLSLASGLLFGPVKGALLMLAGTSTAATAGFFLSRTVGRTLAQKIVQEEMKESGAGSQNAVTDAFKNIEDAIEAGSFLQQVTAVTLLRLTPVIPFSASNYLLGMTPLPYWPFLCGSIAGMSVWSVIYASLGGASRALLEQGVEPQLLLADLAGKAGKYSEKAVVLGLIVGGCVLAAWAMGLRLPAEQPTHEPARRSEKEPLRR